MKHLDKLCKQIVADMEDGRCYVCGREGTDLAHLFVRNKLATRWDVAEDGNCHILCRECHDKDHRGLEVYSEAYIRKNGLMAYNDLRLRSNQMIVNVKAFIAKKEWELNDAYNRK